MQLPSLPSMSSLLAASEPPGHPLEAEQRQYAFAQRPFPTHLSHPLHFSETNPSAPLHHLYQPPQPNRASYQTAPVLIPAHNNLLPMQYEAPPAQQRQSKSIIQRRDLFNKENGPVHRYPEHLESRVEELAPPPRRPSEQDRDQYSPRSINSSSQVSPRDMTHSKSIPISNLLTGSTRYGSSCTSRSPPKKLTLIATNLSAPRSDMDSLSASSPSLLGLVGSVKEIGGW